MSIRDAKLVLASEQAITATAVGENVLNMGAALARWGEGEQLYVHLLVEETFVSGAEDGTLTTHLQMADVVAMSTPQLAGELIRTEAQLLAGEHYRMALPGGFDVEQFLRLNFTVGGTGDFTAGQVSSWIGPEGSTKAKINPDARNIA